MPQLSVPIPDFGLVRRQLLLSLSRRTQIVTFKRIHNVLQRLMLRKVIYGPEDYKETNS